MPDRLGKSLGGMRVATSVHLTSSSRKIGRQLALRCGLLVVLLSLVLTACSGQSSRGSATTTTKVSPVGSGSRSPDSHTTAAPSSGCGRIPVAAPGTSVLSLTVAGAQRTVILHIPTGYAGHPTPLVLNMHGSQSTAAQQLALSGMDATADADSFIVAYPQAFIPSGAGFEWNVPGQPLFGGAPVPAGSPDDVTFLEQVVSTIGQSDCIDTNRVFATGFSGGARMASQLGCDASQVFAAIAPVSGLRLPTPCPSTRPVPVVSFHGTADPVDPYLGKGQAYWTYSVPTAADRWGTHNGCAATPVTTHPAAGATLTAYGSCSADADVELYTLAGEGHEWPGGPHLRRAITDVLGPQSSAVDANSVMWAFFEAHPLP